MIPAMSAEQTDKEWYVSHKVGLTKSFPSRLTVILFTYISIDDVVACLFYCALLRLTCAVFTCCSFLTPVNCCCSFVSAVSVCTAASVIDADRLLLTVTVALAVSEVFVCLEGYNSLL